MNTNIENINNQSNTEFTSEKENETFSIDQNQEEKNSISIPEKKEITLDKNIILESFSLYNNLSSNYNKNIKDFNSLNDEEKEKLLLSSELFLLNQKNINHIDNLNPYVNLKELYLNKNEIFEIKNLENLKNLEILNLSFNNIKKIENIKFLNKLQLLDISNNFIENFDINEIPLNIIYLYCYYNNFFDKMDFFTYRSIVIRNCKNIERIDKLDVKDREKLILFDESNLKFKNRLKSLNYILKHYEDYNKLTDDKNNFLRDSIQKNIEAVMNKKKEVEDIKKEKNNIIKEYENNNNNNFEEIEKKENKEILNKINELQQKSDEFLKESIITLKEKSEKYNQKSKENRKRFLESDTVKELTKQIKILDEKFKSKTFLDPKIKEAFQRRIEAAINFQQKITKAENIYQEVVKKLETNSIPKKLNQNDKKNSIIEEIKNKQFYDKQPNLINDKKPENKINKKNFMEDEIPSELKESQNEELNSIEERKKMNKKEKIKNNPLLSDSDLEDDNEEDKKIENKEEKK